MQGFQSLPGLGRLANKGLTRRPPLRWACLGLHGRSEVVTVGIAVRADHEDRVRARPR